MLRLLHASVQTFMATKCTCDNLGALLRESRERFGWSDTAAAPKEHQRVADLAEIVLFGYAENSCAVVKTTRLTQPQRDGWHGRLYHELVWRYTELGNTAAAEKFAKLEAGLVAGGGVDPARLHATLGTSTFSCTPSPCRDPFFARAGSCLLCTRMAQYCW